MQGFRRVTPWVCRSAIWVLLSVPACGPVVRAQTAVPLVRALPLNHFPDSRQIGTDPRGFYYMPTAIGDDYFDGTSPLDRVRRHFQIARQLGTKYFRCAFSWNAIEKEPGKYDWAFWDALVGIAEQNGIQIIPYVAYTPEWAARDAKDFWKQPPRDPQLYADFMNRIGARYRGRIRSWEIWNEPDNKDYWAGTADDFAALVRAAAVCIRAADPQAVLVLGGMANGPGEFFRRLMAGCHIDGYVDVIAAHAYPETWLTERAEVVFRQWIPEIESIIAANGSGDDLWVNEMGYADYRFTPSKASVYGINVFYKHEHTRRYQAEMLFKFFVMTLASQEVSLAGWYRIDDFPPAETRLGTDLVNYHLGIVDARGRPKPALFAMEFFNRLFRTQTVLAHTRVVRPMNSQSIVSVFRTKDNRVVVVGWLRSSEPDEVPKKTGMLKDTRSEVITAELPCTPAGPFRYYDAQGHPLRPQARLRGRTLSGIRLRGDRVFAAEFACRAGPELNR